MTRSLITRTTLTLAALLLAGSAGNLAYAQDATPMTSPVATPDAALEAQLDAIARETAELRGLPPLADIDDRVFTRDELKAELPRMIEEELDRAELAAATRALEALGLLPPGSDLEDLTLRLLGEQVAGFYDPLTDEMYVVEDGEFSAEAYYYAHETTHALQDAYLDPDDLMEVTESDNDDESMAQAALYEGDAVVTSNEYLARHPDLLTDLLREASGDTAEMDAAPAAAVVTLIFPYLSGQPFVEKLLDEGGWEAVNAAYEDMPTSTEQILHPEKYFQRDYPVTLALPAAADAMGAGWGEQYQNTLGELQISLLLADLPPGGGYNAVTGAYTIPGPARNAAAGWDGDRYAIWADNAGHEALVWRTAWDTPQDARAFAASLTRFQEERWNGLFTGETAGDTAMVTDDVAARILLRGNEVFYVQSTTLEITDLAQGALLSAPAPDPAPGPR